MTLPVRRVPLSAQQKRIFILVAIALLLAVIGGIAGTRLLTRPRKVRRSVQADLRALRAPYADTLSCLRGARRHGLGEASLVSWIRQGALANTHWPAVIRRCRWLARNLLGRVHGVAGAADAQSDRVPEPIRSAYHQLRAAAEDLEEALSRIADHALAGYRLPPIEAAQAADRAARRYEEQLRQVARLAGLPHPAPIPMEEPVGPRRPVRPAPLLAPALARRIVPWLPPGPLRALPRHDTPAEGLYVLLRARTAGADLLWIHSSTRATLRHVALPVPTADGEPGPIRILAALPDDTWHRIPSGWRPAPPAHAKAQVACLAPLLWARALWSPSARQGRLQVGISCATELPDHSDRLRKTPPSPPVGPGGAQSRPRGAPDASSSPPRPAAAHPAHAAHLAHAGRTPAPRRRPAYHWSLRLPAPNGVSPRPEAGILWPDGTAWLLASTPHGLGRRLVRFRLAPDGRWSAPETIATNLASEAPVGLWPVAPPGHPLPAPRSRSRMPAQHPGPSRGTAPAPGAARPIPTGAPVADLAPTHALWVRHRSGNGILLLLSPAGPRRQIPLPTQVPLLRVCAAGGHAFLLDAVGSLWTVPVRGGPPRRLRSGPRGLRSLDLACLPGGVALAWTAESPLPATFSPPPATGSPPLPVTRRAGTTKPRPPVPARMRPRVRSRAAPSRQPAPATGYVRCGPTACGVPVLLSWSRVSRVRLLPGGSGVLAFLSGPDSLLLRRDTGPDRAKLGPARLVAAWNSPPADLFVLAARPEARRLVVVIRRKPLGAVTSPRSIPHPAPTGRTKPSPHRVVPTLLGLVSPDGGAHWEAP